MQESRKPVIKFPDSALQKAKKGIPASVLTIVAGAIRKLDDGKPIGPPDRAIYLAEVFGKLSLPGLRDNFKKVERCLLNNQPLPKELKTPAITFLSDFANDLREAIDSQRNSERARLAERAETFEKARAAGEELPTPHCSALFEPTPRITDYGKLDPQILAAFGLTNANRPGKSRHERPPYNLLLTYRDIRGCGANKTEAMNILAHRFGYKSSATIARKLEWFKTTRYVVPHDFIPFEPYLKARLAVAVERLRESGMKEKNAMTQAAIDFGLDVDSILVKNEPLGSHIVRTAVEACRNNCEGWAAVPLYICKHEKGKPVIWPTPEHVADLVADPLDMPPSLQYSAISTGESPSTLDIATIFQNRPQPEAVKAAASHFGLDYDFTHGFCLQRIDIRLLSDN